MALIFVTFILAFSADAEEAYLFDVDKSSFSIETSIGSFPVVVGKIPGDKVKEGDRKTPQGVYVVTREIPSNILAPDHGKWAFHLSFPNTWDRMNGITGSNIWIHGTKDEDRTDLKRDTKGCIALKNSDLSKLLPILRESLVFVRITKDKQQIPEKFDETQLEKFRQAWESKDYELFSSFFHPDFRTADRSRSSYLNHKKDLFRRYKYIKLKFENPIIINHPKYAFVAVHQVYESNQFRSEGTKIFYFRDGKLLSEDFTHRFNIRNASLHQIAESQTGSRVSQVRH